MQLNNDTSEKFYIKHNSINSVCLHIEFSPRFSFQTDDEVWNFSA